MCKICKCSACPATCPNAEPTLYCAQCDEKIRKGSTYFSAIGRYYYTRKLAFCSKDCLISYFEIEEEQA